MDTVAVIRDLAIILLAILNIIFLVILILIVIQVWRLVKYLRRELPGFAGQARETLTRIEGTTDFLGTTVAKPAIQAVSFGVAVRRFLRVLTLGRSRQEVRR